jgi:heat-inducible transcriptional repressor
LNEKLNSLTFAEAQSLLESFQDDNCPLQDKRATLAKAVMRETLDDAEPRGVFLDGMENIFEEPEFKDVERLRPILRVFDEKQHLNDWIEYCMPREEESAISIRIGSENPLDGVRGCSIIVSPYRVSGQVRGAIGVIGPTRMRYSRASSLVAYIAGRLGRVLTDVCGG